MFQIEMIDVSQGRICIGDFSETFEIDTIEWSSSDYSSHWREQLQRLVEGDDIVTLAAWTCSSRRRVNRRAWILYRMNEEVFVQERLYPVDQDYTSVEISADGAIEDRRSPETLSEDGEPISEWSTSISAIEHFLAADTPN